MILNRIIAAFFYYFTTLLVLTFSRFPQSLQTNSKILLQTDSHNSRNELPFFPHLSNLLLINYPTVGHYVVK
jgi:hypothetical protein